MSAADLRLLLLIKPPPPVAGEVGRVRRLLGLEDSYGEGRVHFTLFRFPPALGVDPGLVRDIGAAAESFDAEVFRVVVDRVQGGALTGSEPIRGLIAFEARLRAHFARAGLVDPRVHCSPHMTLSYRDRDHPPRSIDGISWLVEDFRLVASGQGRHHERGRWRLRPRAQTSQE